MDTSTKLFTFLWTQQQRVVTKQCTHSFVLSSNQGDKCFQFSPMRRYKYEHSNHGAHSEAYHRTTNKKKGTGLYLSTYKDINMSTAITDFILKLKTGRQTRETKQKGRNRNREEETGYESVMPHNTRLQAAMFLKNFGRS